MYRRILVALDGSELAERILPHVEALSEKFGAAVTLLRATTPPETLLAATAQGGTVVEPPIDPTPVVEAEEEDAENYLRAVADRLRRDGVTIDAEHSEGDPAQTILSRARELPADLIAMTTHGRGGLGRVVFGSVADEVLRHASCPVLLVRIPEDEAQ